MGYILHARSHEGELPRMVWLEGTGEGDLVRMTVANAMGILAVGSGHADEMESFGAGADRCLCSGDIWMEATDEPHVWNVSVINAASVGDVRLSSFEFACAVQRVQMERMNYIGAPERVLTPAETKVDEDVRDLLQHSFARTAPIES